MCAAVAAAGGYQANTKDVPADRRGQSVLFYPNLSNANETHLFKNEKCHVSVNESKQRHRLHFHSTAVAVTIVFSFFIPRVKLKKNNRLAKDASHPSIHPPNPFISFYLDKETSFGRLCLQFLALCHIVQTKPKPSPPIETLLQTACLAAARCRFPSKKSEKGTKVVAKMASQL